MPAENMSSCGKLGRVISVPPYGFLFTCLSSKYRLDAHVVLQSATVFKRRLVLRFTPRRDRRRLPWPMAFDFEYHRPAKEGSDYDQSAEYPDALGGFVQQDRTDHIGCNQELQRQQE